MRTIAVILLTLVGCNPTADPPKPACFEDQAVVVAPDPDPNHGLTWVCVTLDDFVDAEGMDRLDTILAG